MFSTETLALHGPTLLGIARASILNGLREGRPAPVRATDYAAPLRAEAACFVTLHLDGALRGCTGTAVARRALAEDVSGNAFTSAFADPRFAPLGAAEFSRLETEISVLSAAEPLGFDDEAALLDLLVPGEDGLVIECGDARALFLPQVWRTLPSAADFLSHLKEKAGLPSDPLTPAVRASRFRVVTITE